MVFFHGQWTGEHNRRDPDRESRWRGGVVYGDSVFTKIRHVAWFHHNRGRRVRRASVARNVAAPAPKPR